MKKKDMILNNYMPKLTGKFKNTCTVVEDVYSTLTKTSHFKVFSVHDCCVSYSDSDLVSNTTTFYFNQTWRFSTSMATHSACVHM